MPTRRFDINKEQSIGQFSGNNRGSGKDDHAPVGKHNSANTVWRSLERYAHDFSGMYQITSAILHRKTTGQVHTAFGGSPRILTSRLTAAFGMGGGGENNWTSGSAEDWPGPSQSTTGQSDSGVLSDNENNWVTQDVTDLIGLMAPTGVKRADGSAGGAATNFGLRIMSFDEASASRTLEFYGMRSAYPPYIIVTYTVNNLPDRPVAVSPTGATTGTVVFNATGNDPDAGDTFANYDLRIWNGATLHYSGTALTAGRSGWDLVNAPYAGPALSNNVEYEWETRFTDNHGGTSLWSLRTPFTLQALPTVGTQTPANNGLAPVHNIGDLAVWTGAGSHAKPRLAFVYNSAAGLAMAKYRLFIDDSGGTNLYDSGWVNRTAAAGDTVSVDANYAIVNGTGYRWRVQVEDSAGSQSAISTFLNFKVRWGQAILSYNAGGSSSSWNTAAGVLGGSDSQMAAIFQSAGDAAGTVTPSAWFAQVGQVPVQAYVRVLIRLATAASGTNATLADYTFQSTSASQQPDNWTVFNGTLVLDPSVRRYGYYAARVTATGNACYIAPFRKTAGDGVLVQPNVKYTLSVWVRTEGVLNVPLILRVWNNAVNQYLAVPVAPVGHTTSTTDTRSKQDGWQRLVGTFTVPDGVTSLTPGIQFAGAITNGTRVWIDGWALEEGSVASAWKPGFLGDAVTIDAYGINIDRSKGGTLRLRGATGGVRDIVELGPQGLLFGADTELASPSVGVLEINGVPIGSGGGGGAPTTADYLVGTAQAGLSAEIVVGTTPGGELGGTWASPTVDATHSGSSHAGVITAHEALSDPHTGYRLESADHTHASSGLQGGQIAHASLTSVGANDHHAQVHSISGSDHTGTLLDAQIPATIARDTEVTAAVTAHEALSDPHTAYALDSDLSSHAAASDPHTGYQRESEKDAASGYPGLDSLGFLFSPKAKAASFMSSRNDADATPRYTKIASGSLTTQFQMSMAMVAVMATDLQTSNVKRGIIRWNVTQALAFGSDPQVTVEIAGAKAWGANDLVVVVTSNAGPTTYEVYVLLSSQWERVWFAPLVTDEDALTPTWYESQSLSTTLPSGTQYAWASAHSDGTTDPHPEYALDTDLSAHSAASDPHTGYRLESADHTHASTGLQGGTIAHSVLTGISATDHHAAPAAGPDADITVDAAGAAGTASTFARSAHGHKLTTYASVPAAIAASGAAGTSATAPSRGDHAHAHPVFASGDLHTEYALDTDLSNHSAAANPHTVYPLATSGTFTPVATFATPGDLVATASIALGRWRKIGNTVFWWVRLSLSTFTFTTASGLFKITGNNAGTPLNLTNMNWLGPASLRFTLANYTWAQSYVATNDSNIYVRLGGSGQNPLFLDKAHMTTAVNPDIMLSGSYEV